MTNPINILGIKISAVDLEEAVKLVVSRIPDKKGNFFCFSNVHTLMVALKDNRSREAVSQANEIFVDGMGIALSLKMLGIKNRGRVRGKDLMLKLCSYAASNNLGVALYGTTNNNLLSLTSKLNDLFPGIRVVKAIAPPFRELTPDEDKMISEEINKSGADILFVALSSPMQEKWMAWHKNNIKPVQLSVGAAFDFITGEVAEAPLWMQKIALEWLFRLFQQPVKVIGRMFLVPEFIFRLFIQIAEERCLKRQKILF